MGETPVFAGLFFYDASTPEIGTETFGRVCPQVRTELMPCGFMKGLVPTSSGLFFLQGSIVISVADERIGEFSFVSVGGRR